MRATRSGRAPFASRRQRGAGSRGGGWRRWAAPRHEACSVAGAAACYGPRVCAVCALSADSAVLALAHDCRISDRQLQVKNSFRHLQIQASKSERQNSEQAGCTRHSSAARSGPPPAKPIKGRVRRFALPPVASMAAAAPPDSSIAAPKACEGAHTDAPATAPTPETEEDPIVQCIIVRKVRGRARRGCSRCLVRNKAPSVMALVSRWSTCDTWPPRSSVPRPAWFAGFGMAAGRPDGAGVSR